MKFDPKYIELCDCKEIQGLKKKYYEGDWGITEDNVLGVNIFDGIDRPNYIWLPLEHQIDHKITYLCEKDHEYDYRLYFDSISETWYLEIYESLANKVLFSEDAYDENILIAKIKLLKKLLKESE